LAARTSSVSAPIGSSDCQSWPALRARPQHEQATRQLIDACAECGIGRLGWRAPERREVGALVEPRQRRDRRDRTSHRLGVGVQEDVGQRRQLGAPPVEAGGAQAGAVIGVARALAALARRRAPRGRVPVELAGDALEAVARVGDVVCGGQKGRPHLLARVAVGRGLPDARQPGRRVASGDAARPHAPQDHASDDDRQEEPHRDPGGRGPRGPVRRDAGGQLGEEGVHVGEALGPIDRQAAEERRLDPAGHAAAQRARTRLAGQDVAAQLEQRRPLEGAGAVQRLPEGHAEAELIGARIDRLPHHLLGRHVERRPQDGAHLRQADLLRVPRAGGGQSEVHDPGAAVARHHHVLRLEVAMDDAGAVRGGEAASRHQEHVEDLARGARLAGQPDGERLPLDELHGQEHPARRGTDVVDRHHVGVREAGHRLGLAREPSGFDVVGARVGAEDLDRDLAIELGVVRRVDLAHPAPPDQAQQAIAADRQLGGRRPRPAAGLRGWGGHGDQRRAGRAIDEVPLDGGQGGPAQRARDERDDGLLVETVHEARDYRREGPLGARTAPPRAFEPGRGAPAPRRAPGRGSLIG
jgi:hypothetical protein